MTTLKDMPKLESPFRRKINDKGNYVVIDEINPGYEWVFNDPYVMAIEKLDGTNVSIEIKNGEIVAIMNRTAKIPFFSKTHKFIVEGVLNSFEKGYLNNLSDGQYFGELIGEKIASNPYKIKSHLWLPFNGFCKKHLVYKSWGKYSKDFKTISEWFKNDLIPLYSCMVQGSEGRKNGFVEGIVFTHPDGRMAKLRRDMFDWCGGKRHKEVLI